MGDKRHHPLNKICQGGCDERTVSIPKKIMQTWKDHDIPLHWQGSPVSIQHHMPDWEYIFLTDPEIQDYMEQHHPEYLEYFNNFEYVIQKIDFFRVLWLYDNGGIYMDIKLVCVNGFKLIELTEANHFVKDRLSPLSIFNSCMVCQQNHPYLLMAIKKIVNNVNANFYGSNPLEPTGPAMLGNLFLNNRLKANIDMTHYEKGGFIIFKNRFVISTEYPEYNSERTNTYNSINTKRYDALWFEKKIYK